MKILILLNYYSLLVYNEFTAQNYELIIKLMQIIAYTFVMISKKLLKTLLFDLRHDMEK